MPPGPAAPPGLGREADVITLGELAARLERLGDEPDIDPRQWARYCAALCPELYGTPPASAGASRAAPGSRCRRWRYEQRLAHGRQVFAPGDLTHG